MSKVICNKCYVGTIKRGVDTENNPVLKCTKCGIIYYLSKADINSDCDISTYLLRNNKNKKSIQYKPYSRITDIPVTAQIREIKGQTIGMILKAKYHGNTLCALCNVDYDDNIVLGRYGYFDMEKLLNYEYRFNNNEKWQVCGIRIKR